MVHFSESFKSFLNEQANQGAVIARLIMSALNNQYAYPAYKKVLTTAEADFITMRPDGMVSYLPAGKEHKVNDRGEWQRDGRQAGKAGKVIRKIFTEKMLRLIPAKEFETFGNAYKAKFLDNGFKFEVLPNDEIGRVYDMDRAPGESSLEGSCMNGDSHYLGIYSKCEDLRILVLTNKKGLLCGRCLVWDLDHPTHGKITFADRFYVAEDYMYDVFVNHVREQGWWRKEYYKTYDHKQRWINPQDESVSVSITIETPTDFDKYPYIDTFSYGSDGLLTNSSHSAGEYTYCNTNGTRDCNGCEDEEDEHAGEVFDEINNEWISEDDAIYLCDEGERRYRNVYVHHNNAVAAMTGHRRSEWFYEGDNNVCEINGEWYWTGHDDVITRADGEYDLIDNCVRCKTDDEFYESSDDDMLEYDGDYYHKENDDDVIYVNALDNEDGGDYKHINDVEGDVVKEVSSDQWYYTDDKRLKRVELHVGASCGKVWAMKIDLLKWRNKIYHKDDSRIVNKPTRKAYPTL